MKNFKEIMEVSTSKQPSQTANPNVMDYGPNNQKQAEDLVFYLYGEVKGIDQLKEKLKLWVDNNKNVVPSDEFKKACWEEYDKLVKRKKNLAKKIKKMKE